MFYWMQNLQARWFAWLMGPPVATNQLDPDKFCEKIIEVRPGILYVRAWESGHPRDYLFSFRSDDTDKDSVAYALRLTGSAERPIPAKFRAYLQGTRVSNPAALLEKFVEYAPKPGSQRAGLGQIQ